jgi:peptidoglycan/LPS O-acetylase OafA/YrhL
LYRGTAMQDVALLEMGWFGVDIFFLLSGFILSHVHLCQFQSPDWRTARTFLFLRLSRIYPVHLFSLLVVVGFFFLTVALGKPLEGRPRFQADLLIANLFLVQSWGWAKNDSWNVLAWSISTEWCMYLLFPLVATLVARQRNGTVALIGAGLALLVMETMIRGVGLNSTFTTYEWGILRNLGSFLAGCLLFVAFRSGRFDGFPWAWIELGCMASLLIAVLVWRSSFAALPAAAGLIFALASGKGWISWLCGRRSSLFLGEISYSLYMMHMVVLEVCFLPLAYSRYGERAPAAVWLGWYSLALVMIALVTFGTYRYVERPSQIWLRKLIAERRL